MEGVFHAYRKMQQNESADNNQAQNADVEMEDLDDIEGKAYEFDIDIDPNTLE